MKKETVTVIGTVMFNIEIPKELCDDIRENCNCITIDEVRDCVFDTMTKKPVKIIGENLDDYNVYIDDMEI